jgi:hypothetical protein
MAYGGSTAAGKCHQFVTELSCSRRFAAMDRAIKVAAAVLAIGLCPLPSARAADLTPAEIEGELVGRQIVWWEEDGWLVGRLTLDTDGSAELDVDRPQRRTDTGRWMLRGDELCTVWTSMRAAEKCYRIKRSADGRFVTTGGNVFEIARAGA